MQPDTDAVLRLVGRWVSAHACPIGPDLALTSAHVTDIRPFDNSQPAYPLFWSALGHDGILKPVSIYGSRDLAVMESATPFVRWYAIAASAPTPGDRLETVGYEWRKQAEMYGPRTFHSRLLRVIARTLVFAPPITVGASGACVLNMRGEVVGINSGVATGQDAGEVGVAVGVWGETFERPPQ